MSETAKNTAPREQGAEKFRSVLEDREIYLVWKQNMARSGKTPEAVVAYYRKKGFTDYADRLEEVILRMKGTKLELSDIKTCDLVQELMKREGIEATIAEPYKDVEIHVSGPAIVLVVYD